MNDNTNSTIERPPAATDDVLTYLDDLRESGVTNMFGASVYLENELSMSEADAKAAWLYWVRTFNQRHPQE